MALNAVHNSIDEIPEQYRDLYTEKSGKYELTGIIGVKTQADIDRLQTSLHKAQQDNKDLKSKFSVWGDMNHEEVMQKLDRIPELEALSKGKLDETEIEQIVNQRVEGTIKSQMGPLERQVSSLTQQLEQTSLERDSFAAKEKQRKIHDAVRASLTELKVIPEAHDDALMLAERVFEIREDDGAVVTKDSVGVTPGVNATMWLQEMQPKRSHWWPASQGGGATGSSTSGLPSGKNPWSVDSWNVTEQGNVLRNQGAEVAARLASAAGTKVGGTRPEK